MLGSVLVLLAFFLVPGMPAGIALERRLGGGWPGILAFAVAIDAVFLPIGMFALRIFPVPRVPAAWILACIIFAVGIEAMRRFPARADIENDLSAEVDGATVPETEGTSSRPRS